MTTTLLLTPEQLEQVNTVTNHALSHVVIGRVLGARALLAQLDVSPLNVVRVLQVKVSLAAARGDVNLVNAINETINMVLLSEEQAFAITAQVL